MVSQIRSAQATCELCGQLAIALLTTEMHATSIVTVRQTHANVLIVNDRRLVGQKDLCQFGRPLSGGVSRYCSIQARRTAATTLLRSPLGPVCARWRSTPALPAESQPEQRKGVVETDQCLSSLEGMALFAEDATGPNLRSNGDLPRQNLDHLQIIGCKCIWFCILDFEYSDDRLICASEATHL